MRPFCARPLQLPLTRQTAYRRWLGLKRKTPFSFKRFVCLRNNEDTENIWTISSQSIKGFRGQKAAVTSSHPTRPSTAF